MLKFLAPLVVAGAATLGLAGKADASPLGQPDVVARRRTHIGIGLGFGGGFGSVPVASGYWATQVQWVPTTFIAGYDPYGRPIYETRYVQQAYQVWVPTTYYAASYGPTLGVGLRFWR